ncbi:SH3 domain-containing protein [Streptomyces sp. bgisy100]|uniref:SH3 domain-containing protein n=1 Tax=Streptomyces sp. bgisy100 TaxID=3413783 RepID=UPI003D72B412
MPQSKLRRLAVAAATGTLATLTAIGPAVADSGPDGTDPRSDSEGFRSDSGDSSGDPRSDSRSDSRSDNGDQRSDGRDHRAPYRGRVTARSGLILRDAPSLHARIVGQLPHGTVVRISCKVNSDDVAGNPRWYLLENGQWAWASARYIENIGPAPAWC